MQTTSIQNPSLTQNLSTSIATILATPPSATGSIVSGVTFANKSGGTVTIQFSVFNGTTDFYVAFNAPIAAGDSLVFGGENLKLMLTNGFSLRALCNTASAVDVTVHYANFT
jgi:hypothetical protein